MVISIAKAHLYIEFNCIPTIKTRNKPDKQKLHLKKKKERDINSSSFFFSEKLNLEA